MTAGVGFVGALATPATLAPLAAFCALVRALVRLPTLRKMCELGFGVRTFPCLA